MASVGNEPLVGENENLVRGGVFFLGCGGISFGGFATENVNLSVVLLLLFRWFCYCESVSFPLGSWGRGLNL